MPATFQLVAMQSLLNVKQKIKKKGFFQILETLYNHNKIYNSIAFYNQYVRACNDLYLIITIFFP